MKVYHIQHFYSRVYGTRKFCGSIVYRVIAHLRRMWVSCVRELNQNRGNRYRLNFESLVLVLKMNNLCHQI